MNESTEIISEDYFGVRKSKLPAKLDYWQSATGLFLGLFMWGHMFFVSSILISKDFMYRVTKFFEGGTLLSEPHPWIVSIMVAIVFVIFIVHATLAMRKLPSNYKQYRLLRRHVGLMKHDETTMWYVQAWTGFVMFFAGSAHLFLMLTQPDTIGPYASSDRMVTIWPFYILLLFAVELHGSIGLYRLCVKWGWFDGDNPNQTRQRLKKLKWVITVFFLALGILTLAAYLKIGLEHRDHAGKRYVPSAQIDRTGYNHYLSTRAHQGVPS